ncbi:hypothetical protein [Clostridium butyricum]|uniref:hypothetical protein n=1 Tax=Clostridium butyricum TaxID=1492 RepID=UPI00325AC766
MKENKILTIEDIIAKKEECKKRKEVKKCYIESEFLGGKVEGHSLTKNDVHDVRDHMKNDREKGARYFIYLSIDKLRNKELLTAFGRNKGDNTLIVEDIFTDIEQQKIIDNLSKLNGWESISDTDILMQEVDFFVGE